MTTLINIPTVKAAFRIGSIVVFFAGSMMYAYAQYGLTQADLVESQKKYVITFREISIDAQGKRTSRAIIIAELKQDGGWVSTRYSTQSSNWSQSTVSESGMDIVTSGGNRHHHEETAPNVESRKQMSTEEFYRNHPNFSGEDTLLGYHVFKLKYYLPDGSWREKTFAPRIGAFRLRYLIHNQDGSEILQEAIRIEKK